MLEQRVNCSVLTTISPNLLVLLVFHFRTCLMLWERAERNFLPWPRIKATEELFFIVFSFSIFHFFNLLSLNSDLGWFCLSFYCVHCITQSSYAFPYLMWDRLPFTSIVWFGH